MGHNLKPVYMMIIPKISVNKKPVPDNMGGANNWELSDNGVELGFELIRCVPRHHCQFCQWQCARLGLVVILLLRIPKNIENKCPLTGLYENFFEKLINTSKYCTLNHT